MLTPLRAATEARGLQLAPRLPVYPEYVDPRWIDAAVLPHVLHAADAEGLARDDAWAAGAERPVPFVPR